MPAPSWSSPFRPCFAHGQRHLRVCKRIHLGEESPSIAEAAARELHIYKRLSAAPDASRRMIQLVDHERSENKLTLLMEYGGGGTLEGWRPEDAAELVSTCTAMLRCLDWLHKEHVAHLDIKPANFVFAGGRLKLIDFGVARMLDSTDSVLTLDAPFPGSVDYLAPEAICGKTNPFPPHDDASPMSDEALYNELVEELTLNHPALTISQIDMRVIERMSAAMSA